MLRGINWYSVINLKKKTLSVEKYDLNIAIRSLNSIYTYCIL